MNINYRYRFSKQNRESVVPQLNIITNGASGEKYRTKNLR